MTGSGQVSGGAVVSGSGKVEMPAEEPEYAETE
jgi:hypothetical protein